ncbi:MAG: hypothetical protein PHH77_09115 [Victivallaceae bacterium]|nr:hypothetical protein [Victivallaceae bacterium]
MVKGLELFRERFAAFADRYILIGGAACDIILNRAAVPFRVTRDFDIVLCVESLDADFGTAFWNFIKAGGYQIREKTSGAKQFYRFSKPVDPAFPVMLELFSRQPDTFDIANESQLTPIPIDDEVSSLSAILLDDAYYTFIQASKIEIEGISLITPECLIVLKAKAWFDLTERRQRGEAVDSKDIRKHKNDICRLFAVLSPTVSITLPPNMKNDIAVFLGHLKSEPVNCRALGLPFSVNEIISGLNKLFDI